MKNLTDIPAIWLCIAAFTFIVVVLAGIGPVGDGTPTLKRLFVKVVRWVGVVVGTIGATILIYLFCRTTFG